MNLPEGLTPRRSGLRTRPRLTKHGRDARATGSEGLRARASFDSQQMKQIKQIEEQKAGGRLNHLFNLVNLQ